MISFVPVCKYDNDIKKMRSVGFLTQILTKFHGISWCPLPWFEATSILVAKTQHMYNFFLFVWTKNSYCISSVSKHSEARCADRTAIPKIMMQNTQTGRAFLNTLTRNALTGTAFPNTPWFSIQYVHGETQTLNLPEIAHLLIHTSCFCW